jgi:hypothetical protein
VHKANRGTKTIFEPFCTLDHIPYVFILKISLSSYWIAYHAKYMLINLPLIMWVNYIIWCDAESLAFGCHLEASKKKDLIHNTCLIHMLLLMTLGKFKALTEKYTCKIINFIINVNLFPSEYWCFISLLVFLVSIILLLL